MTDNIKSHIRDINLDILLNSKNKFDIDISKRYKHKFRLFYPNRKLIKYITSIGGVLIGSRSLRCYTLNGESILSRDSDDWDFVVTLDMAYKILNFQNTNHIPEINDTISFKNQRYWRHPAYSDSYRVGPVDVQIIIADELPLYSERDKIRIADISYSINQKIKLINKLEDIRKIQSYSDKIENLSYQINKHTEDIKNIIIKINSIKNEI